MTVFSLCDSNTAPQPQNRLAWGYPTLRVRDCRGNYKYVRLCGICHSTAFVAKAHIELFLLEAICPARPCLLVTPYLSSLLLKERRSPR
jgi:hypothetical protein